MTKELPIAIDIITKGGILLYPTDTVYGLGCDARDEKAIERIAKLKNRATNKSYIILTLHRVSNTKDTKKLKKLSNQELLRIRNLSLKKKKNFILCKLFF